MVGASSDLVAAVLRDARAGERSRATMAEEARRVMSAKTLYDIFGVSPATWDETVVRKEFRKLAIKLHPDKNDSPEATEAFRKVSDAVQTLTDPQKRRAYDFSLQYPGGLSRQQQQWAPPPQPRWHAPPQQQQWPPPQGQGQWPLPPQQQWRAPPQPSPPPLGKSMFHAVCSKCQTKLQVLLQNHYGPNSVDQRLMCPTCRDVMTVQVPPTRLPPGWGAAHGGAPGGGPSSAFGGGPSGAFGGAFGGAQSGNFMPNSHVPGYRSSGPPQPRAPPAGVPPAGVPPAPVPPAPVSAAAAAAQLKAAQKKAEDAAKAKEKAAKAAKAKAKAAKARAKAEQERREEEKKARVEVRKQRRLARLAVRAVEIELERAPSPSPVAPSPWSRALACGALALVSRP